MFHPLLFVCALHLPFPTTKPLVMVKPLLPQVFPPAHTVNALPLCAPFVLGETITSSSSAPQDTFGTIPCLLSPNMSIASCSSGAMTNLYVSTGSMVVGACYAPTTTITCPPLAEPSIALAHRRLHPVCPYNGVIWGTLLHHHNLWSQYHKIPNSFWNGFSLHLPPLMSSQVQPNHPSLALHCDAFRHILEHELGMGHYIGPFTRSDLHSLLSTFQTSSVSVIPKAGTPGKFRVFQNFSFPHLLSPQAPQPSINSTVNSNDFPCTRGTFNTVCSIIHHLPPGSQAATHNIAEAYRTILLLPSQWPATVVHAATDSFYVDTCTSFGM